MQATDSLTSHYLPLLEGTYDCVDRIVLNAYIPNLLHAGGVRNWYRMMKGGDEGLSTSALMKFAGRFSRRVSSLCKQRDIPLLHFEAGKRKGEEAKKMIPTDPSFVGLFAVFVSRAPSLLWEVKELKTGSIAIRRKKGTSFVNHYFFHIMDKDWGHITIRMCAHPPFSCNIILNGHEWVERHQGYSQLSATKEENYFTSYSNGEELTLIADTLKEKGQLEQVCQRWIYSCLWCVMDKKQIKDTGIAYHFSIYQIEYSRNLLFNRGRQMDTVYQKIITLTRGRLDIKRLKTIFGRKNRPYNHKSTAPAPQVRIEKPDYNLTIFKIHFGRLPVKLYDKGERTLRAEVVVHNAKDLKCKRGLDSFVVIIEKLETIMESFLSNLDYAHLATIDTGTFEQLCLPSQTGKNRLSGLDFNKKRNKEVAKALLSLSIQSGGFASKDVANILCQTFHTDYSTRKAAYDIRKFKAKNIVEKVPGTIRYIMSKKGIKTMAGVLCIMNKQAPGVLATLSSEWTDQQKEYLNQQDQCLININKAFEQLNHCYELNRAA